VAVQPVEGQQLLVVGDGPVSDALGSIAAVLGLQTVVAGTTEEVAAALPASTAVVVTSHHEGLDAPALAAALAAGPAYVAAMGSRRTQQRRHDWLAAHGVTDAELAALHAPAGLDIGADTPAETALSILGEILAVRAGRDGGPLRTAKGRIHAEAQPQPA